MEGMNEKSNKENLQVESELKALNNSVKNVITLVDTLYERLQNVLISGEIKDDGCIKTPEDVCVLASQIRTTRCDINQVYARIVDILDRLQL